MTKSRCYKALLSAAALAVVGVLFVSTSIDEDDAAAEPPSWLYDGSTIRSITFQETPNVYFVGFESLVPRSAMKTLMGTESTDAHDLFDSEVRRFRNFFTNAPSTETSFNTLLSLAGCGRMIL